MSKTVGSANNTNNVTTYHIWDGENIVAEANSSNAITKSYVRGHQLLTDSSRYAYMYDGHGNLIQQNSGTTNKSFTRYDAFGNVTDSTGSNSSPFGYCGEYTDAETGLIYLRNRYYDTATGSFITEDPAKDGSNWYAYCAGNPVMFWDSLGLSAEAKEAFRQALVYGIKTIWSGYSWGQSSFNGSDQEVYLPFANDLRLLSENASIDESYVRQGIYFNAPILALSGVKDLCWAACEVSYLYSIGQLTDLSKATEEVQKLGNSSRRNENFNGNLPLLKDEQDVSFERIYSLLEEAQRPIGAEFARKDDFGAYFDAHQTLITGAFEMNGNRYISFYDPNSQQQAVKQYNEFIYYKGDSNKKLIKIGIIDDSQLGY